MKLSCDHRLSRWSDLVKSVELWTDVQEMDEFGRYSSVDVVHSDEVRSGGVVQLKHGQQRRILVKVKTVSNSGSLPLHIDSIVQVSVGSVIGRSKFQVNQSRDKDLTREET